MTEQDLADVLAINNANTPAVSELSPEKLAHLVDHSLHALVIELHDIVGFCITFAPGAPYDSLNYQWFCGNYSNFVYLDRIAFNQSAQGLGLGKLLYQHVETHMIETGLPHPLCCEVNIEPPNPGSLRFHQSIGFNEVGQRGDANGYRVSLLAKTH